MRPRHLRRRDVLRLGLAGAASLVGPLRTIPAAHAGEAPPRFLLAIQIQPGVDSTYLFDGKRPILTEKNLQQNYLLKNDNPAGLATMPEAFTPERVAERTIRCERTGAAALRSPLVDALWSEHKDCLSIVNGVYMLRNNAGHYENSAYLFGNADSGGGAIYPPLVGKLLGGAPVEAVILRETLQVSPPPSNLSGSVMLSDEDVGALAQSLSTGIPFDESSPTLRHVLARADANARTGGRFGEGSMNLASGLRRARATAAGFAAATLTEGATRDERPFVRAIRRALGFFTAGLTRVVTITHEENVDLHDSSSSQRSLRDTYAAIAGDLATAIRMLKTTTWRDPSGREIPLIELTTFIVSSEFGRTARSLSFTSGSVGATGSDHNPLANFALVGGRGIVSGLVVGESDLADCDDSGAYVDVSPAHRQKNPKLDQAMGRPFDFETQRMRRDLPASWQETDYICMPSVTNTILDAFGVPLESHFKLGSRPAPLLRVLRSRSA